MEVINIEARTFEAMMTKFESFTRRVDTLCNQNKEKQLGKWYDSQEVCVILNITKRTLQSYRDKGLLPYSQIKRKTYYKPEDVERLIVHSEDTKTNR